MPKKIEKTILGLIGNRRVFWSANQLFNFDFGIEYYVYENGLSDVDLDFGEAA